MELGSSYPFLYVLLADPSHLSAAKSNLFFTGYRLKGQFNSKYVNMITHLYKLSCKMAIPKC